MRFCPHCGGDLARYSAIDAQNVPVPVKYDQTKTWKAIVTKARDRAVHPPILTELVEPVAQELVKLGENLKEGAVLRTIVHIAFDRDIVPRGGVLYRAVLSDGKLATPAEQLEQMGYEVADGKIALVNDVPISKAYSLIDYWGGEKQHKRWHLAERVTINPSRHGEPFFMDAEMLAFGATWSDTTKVREALPVLLNLFAHGVNGTGSVAVPLVIEIAQMS